MPEPTRLRRPGRSAPRGGSPAALGLVRVDADFAEEFPDGDATATEAHASLVRAGQAVLLELDRTVSASFDMSVSAATTLAVIEGSPDPLTPSQIAERVLTPSATMTATLDLLERRGWIRRLPNPDDRRSLLVEVTSEGVGVANRLLAGIRTLESSVMRGLSEAERRQLLKLLAKVMAQVAATSLEPPIALEGPRNRPARLGRPAAD